MGEIIETAYLKSSPVLGSLMFLARTFFVELTAFRLRMPPALLMAFNLSDLLRLTPGGPLLLRRLTPPPPPTLRLPPYFFFYSVCLIILCARARRVCVVFFYLQQKKVRAQRDPEDRDHVWMVFVFIFLVV